MNKTVLQLVIAVQLTKAALYISDGSLVCPGPINFNCTGTEVAITLDWLINDTQIGTWTFRSEVSSFNPVNVPLTTTLPGLRAEVITAGPNADNAAAIDVTSILRVDDVSILSGASIQCQALSLMDSTDVIVLQTPPSPSTFCSLLSSPGGPEVTLQWSPSFTSQHAVERYRVTVNPDPSSCSSDQVSPSEDYSCCGLSLGTNYSITVSAINCGDQEGPTYSMYIDLQVQQIFQIEVLNFSLPFLDVQWSELSLTISEQCLFNGSLSYTVVLETSTVEMVDRRMINSDICINDGICSVSFPISYSALYKVSISVANLFGRNSTITAYHIVTIATTAMNATAVFPTTTLLPRTDDVSDSVIDRITLELYQFILIIAMVILVLLIFVITIVVLLCKFKGQHHKTVVMVTDKIEGPSVTALRPTVSMPTVKTATLVAESVIYDEIQEPSFTTVGAHSATNREMSFEITPNYAYRTTTMLNKN